MLRKIADFSQRHQIELGNVQISCYSTSKQTWEIIKTAVITKEKVAEANISIALKRLLLCGVLCAHSPVSTTHAVFSCNSTQQVNIQLIFLAQSPSAPNWEIWLESLTPQRRPRWTAARPKTPRVAATKWRAALRCVPLHLYPLWWVSAGSLVPGTGAMHLPLLWATCSNASPPVL